MMLRAIGVDSHALGKHERLKVAFLIGGVTSLLASDEIKSVDEYLDLLQGGLANTVRDRLRQVTARSELIG